MDKIPIQNLAIQPVEKVVENMSLYDLLNFMQTGKSHLVGTKCDLLNLFKLLI